MSTLNWVNSTDLNLWANRRESQDKLPLVLRRLVLATGKNINRIDFPTGDSVQVGGWDGMVVADEGSLFVPEGLSGWELGVNKSIKGKADKDYQKRCKDPLGVDPLKSTFIFVTLRRWSQKNKWVKLRNEEGFWAEVRAYDADDLELWLERAPAVQAWLARILGKYPKGASALDFFWDKWRNATKPALNTEIVLAGRQKSVEELTKWTSEPSSSALCIQSESREESQAFFSATVFQLGEEERIAVLARCVIVEDQNAWKHLVATSERLILIPTYDNLSGVADAARNGHQILIPLGKESPSSANTIKLQRLPRTALENALVNMGISQEEAYSIVSDTKRSLPVLRRRLAVTPEISCPVWAKPANAGSLIPILLAGAWDSSNKSDQEIIEQLARESYDQVERTLTRWANESDSPVRKVGVVWQLVSREDSWNLLWRFVSEQDLIYFHDVALSVLTELHPRYELPAEERWLANIHGKVLRHSEFLRKGLAETLALMGARGHKDSYEDSRTAQQRADRIVRRLLSQASHWQDWASLSSLLPLLAEASPNAFLTGVEEKLQGDQPVLLGMFVDEGFLGGSPHTGLLWALETFAWESDYLSRACLILAKLASIDLGGKLLNRPQNSLREIFLSWRPQTLATLEQRMQIIDMIMSKEPDVTWKLLIDLLPKGTGGVSMPIHKPKWRDWGESWEPGMTYSEYSRQIEALFQRALSSVGTSGERWCSLLEKISSLLPKQRDTLVEEVLTLESKLDSAQDRVQIWHKLRRIISRHRRHPDDWAMPSQLVNRLDKAYQQLTPIDLGDRYKWLFSSYYPDFPHPLPNKDLPAKEATIEAARLDAVGDIYANEGINGLINLAQEVIHPSYLGFSLGKCSFASLIELELLDKGLQEEKPCLYSLAHSFVSSRFHATGWDWVEPLLLKQRHGQWSSVQKRQVLCALPFQRRTWDLAEKLGGEAEKQYWKQVSNYYVRELDAPEYVILKLLDHERPYSALDIAHSCTEQNDVSPISPNLIASILEHAAVKEGDHPQKSDILSYKVRALFRLLYKTSEVERSRVAWLEWAYLPILTSEEQAPRLLSEKLCQNPAFFATVLSFVFKSTNEEENQNRYSKDAATRARLGSKLLHSWKQMPGVSPDGSVNPDKLRSWVLEARRVCEASGRQTVGELQIGEILAHSPRGTDKEWPHEAVRDLLEEIESRKVEDGMVTGVMNKRGVTSRFPFEGGRQEKKLATSYRNHAKTIRYRWPRTADVLRRIAESYDYHARRQDVEAELLD